MNILGPIGREADDISMEFIARLRKEAGDDDPEKLLGLVDEALQASKRHQERLRALRLETARVMRGAGVPMAEIAEAARVNDSYLSRMLIDSGARRIVDRTRRRRGAARRGRPPAQQEWSA
jgi:hypothetical protein